MNDELVRISAKNLGQLVLPDYCTRCFWIKLKLGFKLPFQIFPGIFSTIDSYSKKITWEYFDTFKRVPTWFDPFGKFVGLLPVPHWSKFFVVDRETGIRLTKATADKYRKKMGGSLIDPPKGRHRGGWGGVQLNFVEELSRPRDAGRGGKGRFSSVATNAEVCQT